MTNEQKARLLERLATLIHVDPDHEGFYETCEHIGADPKAAGAFILGERDKLLRRAAKLRGGEASTLIGGQD